MTKTLYILALLLLSMTAKAGNISEQDARQLALRFLRSNTAAKAPALEALQLNLIGTEANAYLFNRGTNNGYIIVSSDDRATQPVLGFADKGSLDANNLPENMKWWLSELQRELDYAAKSTAATAPVAKAATDRKPIEPLLKTTWYQDEPYNKFCPEVPKAQEGGDSIYVKAPTGCVATAMAQIMYYHKWPKQGAGSISYVNRVDPRKPTLSRDFSESFYDWDNMLLAYTDSTDYTEQQADAVARLMVDAGYSVKMLYEHDGSGTYNTLVAPALFENFGYDKNMKLVVRDAFDRAEWETLLYKELEEARPIYYGGATVAGGGHAFVFDGYKEQTIDDNVMHYFHINWGWGGRSDGYFVVSSLNPREQGTGGQYSGAGYDYEQSAVMGIRPYQESTVVTPYIYYKPNLTVSEKATTRTDTATIHFTDDFVNYNVVSTNVKFGLKLVDKEDKSVTYVMADRPEEVATGSSSSETNVIAGIAIHGLSQIPAAETEKQYYVYPAFQCNDDDTWHDTHIYIPEKSIKEKVVVATVAGDSIFFSLEPLEYRAKLTSSNVTYRSSYYLFEDIVVTATIKATGAAYEGEIRVKYYWEDPDYGESAITSPLQNVYIEDGDSVKLTFVLGPVTILSEPTEFNFWFVADNELLDNFHIFTTTVLDEEDGIADVSDETDASPRRIYNAAGVLVGVQNSGRLDTSSLPAGLYIIKRGNRTQKVTVR